MELGIMELCVPGKTLKDRLMVLETSHLWLELVSNKDLEVIDSYNVNIRSVQAYKLHHKSLIDKDPAARMAAFEYVKDVIRLANRVQAQNVITVPTYGRYDSKFDFKRCIDVFRTLSSFAVEYDTNILIEPLSPKRTTFLPGIKDVKKLVDDIDRKNVFLMADTCHIYDSGGDVLETVKRYENILKELHIKDTGSSPPGKGEIDFKEIIVKSNIPLCIEYETKNVDRDFENAVSYLVSKR